MSPKSNYSSVFFNLFILNACIGILFHKVLANFNASAECSLDQKNEVMSMHLLCDCQRAKQLTLTSNKIMSSCSDHATARGPKQNVIAYSFYGSLNSGYFSDIEQNIQSIAEIYPGWIMRLYHNLHLSYSNERQVLCRLWCTYPHFDLCNVKYLPPPLCDQSKVFGMIWRFFVLGDILVERFLIRDLDSRLSLREAAAVDHWTKSGKTFHIMRDHPFHYVLILGGMWGGANWNLTQTSSLRTSLITNGYKWRKNYDQIMLARTVWTAAKNDAIIHDSYLCRIFENTVPWPTQRENQSHYVGKSSGWKVHEDLQKVPECPFKCRPRDHIDWTYC